MRGLGASSYQMRSWKGVGAAAVVAALFAIPGVAAAQDAPAATQRTHTVKRGDTLWDIAAAYLGDPFQWPSIYRVNQDVVEDPHWIYPGEVLRLPGAVDADTMDLGEEVEEPPRGQPGPTVFAPVAEAEQVVGSIAENAPLPTVRPGQIVAAPYVDDYEGPRDAGRILDSRELPGIHTETARGRYRQYEEVSITLPADASGRVGERYVAVARGETLEGLGRLLRPTAVLELVRPPVDGQAAIARVNGLFDDLRTEHRLVVMRGLDAPTAQALPLPASAAQQARIRHVVQQTILPTIGSYFVIDGSSAHGFRLGDELLIYEPRREGVAGRPDEAEVPVGRAQVVRATPYATTAVVLSVREPRIERGKWVRVIARMP